MHVYVIVNKTTGRLTDQSASFRELVGARKDFFHQQDSLLPVVLSLHLVELGGRVAVAGDSEEPRGERPLRT